MFYFFATVVSINLHILSYKFPQTWAHSTSCLKLGVGEQRTSLDPIENCQLSCDTNKHIVVTRCSMSFGPNSRQLTSNDAKYDTKMLCDHLQNRNFTPARELFARFTVIDTSRIEVLITYDCKSDTLSENVRLRMDEKSHSNRGCPNKSFLQKHTATYRDGRISTLDTSTDYGKEAARQRELIALAKAGESWRYRKYLAFIKEEPVPSIGINTIYVMHHASGDLDELFHEVKDKNGNEFCQLKTAAPYYECTMTNRIWKCEYKGTGWATHRIVESHFEPRLNRKLDPNHNTRG